MLSLVGFIVFVSGMALMLLPQPRIFRPDYTPLGSVIAALGAVVAIIGR